MIRFYGAEGSEGGDSPGFSVIEAALRAAAPAPAIPDDVRRLHRTGRLRRARGVSSILRHTPDQQSRKLLAISSSSAISGSIWNSGMRTWLFV